MAKLKISVGYTAEIQTIAAEFNVISRKTDFLYTRTQPRNQVPVSVLNIINVQYMTWKVNPFTEELNNKA